MRNPLFKRLPREIKADWSKFAALFLFLTITIGFVSGFLVADHSMKNTYEESFEKYTIENGHFILSEEADEELIEAIEKKDLTIYHLFYKEMELQNGHDIRIYTTRESVNMTDLMEGAYPKKDNEIVIDRLYAENNLLHPGDDLKIEGDSFKITGTVALSDYSALFKNNSSLVFDANRFTVALVTEKAFDKISNKGLKYCYAWVNKDTTLSDGEQKEKADEIKEIIMNKALLTDFMPRQDNQAINFSGEDMGRDKIIMEFILYIIIIVLAFAFAVTAKNTVEKEASAIGTLMASGYSKYQMIFHYMITPLVLLFTASVAGNVLGYTWFKEVIARLYYHSYSLPRYRVLWNGEAFFLTTVIPCMILSVISFLVVERMMRITPLKFLRHELNRRGDHKVRKLTFGGIIHRFRLRVIGQNKGIYATLTAGVFLAGFLLMFATMFVPILANFKGLVKESKFAEYQYVLKMPLETETEGAEKFALKVLENQQGEEITVYGIEENSSYVRLSHEWKDVEEGKVFISDSYAEKYGTEIGEKITLQEKYGKGKYDLEVAGEQVYPAALSVFIPLKEFNRIFGKDETYFTGYFSAEKIGDIDESYISTIITEKDLTLVADQLEDSLGGIFYIFAAFATILFILIMYILSKLIVEKNSRNISLVKVLGYSEGEVARIYNMATGIVVLAAVTITLPLCRIGTRLMFYTMMRQFSGWLTYYMPHKIDLLIVTIAATCYIVVYFIEKGKIKKIPLSQALKNIE